MVFDEKSGEWKPRWGYKRISDSKEDWLLEVPSNAGMLMDLVVSRELMRL
jgi:regulator of ribosome biosynthesis